jgi:hypothetical protein
MIYNAGPAAIKLVQIAPNDFEIHAVDAASFLAAPIRSSNTPRV